ncbi:MAG: FAD-dependent oxidoreductase [Proteobacteria bacterium]|nr:FAD-dependent oxidoreductase [Pseudomonadota bacterium]
MNSYDVIIIGAGSVGVPLALHLAKDKNRVLVIDKNPSPGQGQNKAAIGGIRATHSQISKIKICLKSLEIFSHWEEETGDDIEWYKGGYTYPVYTEKDEKTLEDILVIQKEHNLNINWKTPEEIMEIVPGINPEGLRGGTFSPDDGSASPMLANFSMYKKSVEYGAEYKFREQVKGIVTENGKIKGVITDNGRYSTQTVVNAAGAYGKEIAQLVGVDVPVEPESHEAGITEAYERFLEPMVVDIRPARGSHNYYFYQHKTGQVIFCITPNPNYPGHSRESTSSFLPLISKRLINLMPRLKNARVRRIWRGLYPMTPDGFPVVGKVKEVDGYINAVGMCGQGFMLGPGLGYYLSKFIEGTLPEADYDIFDQLTLYRQFVGNEALK